ncbi:sigma-70 family RNA polymerase sigma factor [Nocardioides sp. BP30]|uniref:RNA polymerase sigma factor n=1 Tax=Nocardioides sp. BP30 TaxID=3036374 RepID=UPI00246996AC|nr:sigma-70 family RNA polymerase sigma factor [Nocardioides sp. BP30]WGL51009.1 sigma-70 family RNA polymerase sigma factor [Nocardioides sp. BP30]
MTAAYDRAEAVEPDLGSTVGIPDNVRPLRPIRPIVAPPTDAELLRRCRHQDPEAWQLLVERYERLIFSVALRNGLSREDAADITQTTFVALIDSLDRVRDEERLASWLMTVARRQAWRLRNTSRRAMPLESAPELAEDPLSDWDTLVTLHDSLSTLGGTCRELLLALYFDPEEPSYVDIAQRFGRAVGGIGPLRGRCLARLRELMAESEAI